MARQTTASRIPATPANQEGVTLYIPAGVEIDVVEGLSIKPGYVRVFWKGYEKGMLGLWVAEGDLSSEVE